MAAAEKNREIKASLWLQRKENREVFTTGRVEASSHQPSVRTLGIRPHNQLWLRLTFKVVVTQLVQQVRKQLEAVGALMNTAWHYGDRPKQYAVLEYGSVAKGQSLTSPCASRPCRHPARQ